MSDMQSGKKAEKRKRMKNTTQEQYETYLHYMETDYIFRTNTVNPTVEPNYLNAKWKELCEKLNSLGCGPALSVEEWKKRFIDWKYATKAKFRKINEHAKKTGSGPKINIEMNHVEERALSVWGKVTVVGANVTAYEGVTIPLEPQIQEIPLVLEHRQVLDTDKQEKNLTLSPLIVFDESLQVPLEGNLKHAQRSQRGRRRVKPLSTLAENLLKTSETSNSNMNALTNIMKTFFDNYLEIEAEKLNLEKEKFKFEAAKYMHANPDFEF